MIVVQPEIEFTREGRIFDETQAAEVLDSAGQVTDLVVVSHGWNNDRRDAGEFYDSLFKSITQVIEADVVAGLAGRTLGLVRVFWPSKRFADADLIPGGGAASAVAENNDAVLRQLGALKQNPQRLGENGRDAVREASLTRAQALVPFVDADTAARREFVFLLRSVLDASEAHPEDGSAEFFTRDPEELFAGLAEKVVAPASPTGGGATDLGEEVAAGLTDLFSGFGAAARRLANFATYYEMKQRAGTVGRAGLAPLLRRLRDRSPRLPLHLVGHSFGGRLVTAAAHMLPPNTPACTVALLQAAYSHNGLGQNYDGAGHDGAFRALISERRASGPIIITHTKNDQAVGIAYPLASRISHDPAAALGDADDPYGGMGRNGAQHTLEAKVQDKLEDVGHTYRWRAGEIYNLRADRFITGHNDVTGTQVANAILHAVATISPGKEGA